jgi:hypothetical protein
MMRRPQMMRQHGDRRLCGPAQEKVRQDGDRSIGAPKNKNSKRSNVAPLEENDNVAPQIQTDSWAPVSSFVIAQAGLIVRGKPRVEKIQSIGRIMATLDGI